MMLVQRVTAVSGANDPNVYEGYLAMTYLVTFYLFPLVVVLVMAILCLGYKLF